VLYEGRLVADRLTAESTPREIVELIVGSSATGTGFPAHLGVGKLPCRPAAIRGTAPDTGLPAREPGSPGLFESTAG